MEVWVFRVWGVQHCRGKGFGTAWYSVMGKLWVKGFQSLGF